MKNSHTNERKTKEIKKLKNHKFRTTSMSLTASIIIEYNPSNSCCLSVGKNGRKILHVFLKSKVGCCLNPVKIILI